MSRFVIPIGESTEGIFIARDVLSIRQKEPKDDGVFAPLEHKSAEVGVGEIDSVSRIWCIK